MAEAESNAPKLIRKQGMPKKTRHPKYEFIPRARGTSPEQQAEWRAHHLRAIDPAREQAAILAYVEAIAAAPDWGPQSYSDVVRQMGRAGHAVYGKPQLRRAIEELVAQGALSTDLAAISAALARTTTKPVRTLSGVAPITVLTAPRVCPGKCIFCPDDVRMPRSYLSNEPGAMRALMLDFDPYVQVDSRLAAMQRTGHTVDKAELLILGGTWSDYPADYQEWFVRRLFDALNRAESATLEEAHRRNETAPHRNTGLVIETRPDYITPEEVLRLRRLGVTRVQLGVQSLDDHILALNGRGHDVNAVRTAMRLLRSAGFKIAVHMMPNLLGATPESDLREWKLLFDDPALRPDEAKLYPTGLLRGTPLYDHYQRGEYTPYDEATLTDLLIACKKIVPEWCRLNRVMRDIPAPDIAAGVITSNLRQVVQDRLRREGTPCRCIRCREVRRERVDQGGVTYRRDEYATDHSREVFLSAVIDADKAPMGDKIAGFVRLSLPRGDAPIAEIDGAAMIRQVQVYGPALALGDEAGGRAQHQGLGRRLIEMAEDEARAAGFDRVAVIAAVGTRDYYRGLGFELGDLYMSKSLAPSPA